MNEDLRIEALHALNTMPNISKKDIRNVIETIQRCYISVHHETTFDEVYLSQELQYFIDGLELGD
ncbi:hypothetical protein [Bacteroides sp. 224]|uniref:hypothetical protein n=1 Tax=Bacteroides sp. 224 TaxID=2302936 RepID=UPI0013D49D0D|nr:hypothetical protein [Bacteroides sp. 224]NDV65595.1 hypothetical protein [Bacteroides sp. 224]